MEEEALKISSALLYGKWYNISIMKQAEERISPSRKYSYYMLLGHATTDIAQGSLPAILPFLVLQHHYSLAAAGGLLLAGNVLSAITQPLFGRIGDKSEKPWFMVVGVLLAGIGIALVGFLDSYVLTAVACVVMGVGVSLFHPEGSKLANIVAGESKGVGMSIFSVGGNVGFTGGPLLATLLIGIFGLRGTAFYVVPAIVTTILLVPKLNEFKQIELEHKTTVKEQTKAKDVEPDNVRGFVSVAVVVFFRSVVMSTLNMMIPFFWVGVFLTSETVGNIHLSIFAAAGIVATLAGGRIAEVVGFRLLYRVCCTALAPLVFLFAFGHSPILGTILLILISMMLSGAQSALMVTGQGFLPNNMGTASGVLFGLTVSMGGIVAPAIGTVGDNYGMVAAMAVIAAIGIGALITVWMIPKHKDWGRKDRAPEVPADEAAGALEPTEEE